MSVLSGRPLIAASLIAAVLVCASPSWAAAPVPIAPSYESLIARLDEMPLALEAANLSEAAEARVAQARALPNPLVGWETENVRGTGLYEGFGAAESTLSISQRLELFGQRSARIGAARAEAAVASLRSEQMRWQAVARLALVYAQAEAAARRYDLAAEALALTEQDARAVSLLVAEGREPALREVLAASETEAVRAAQEEARALRDAGFARLSVIAMLDPPVQAIEHSLLDRLPQASPEKGDAALAVRIAEAELDARARDLIVEQRRARPDVSATIGMRRFRESDDDAFTVGLNLSVPLFDRNRGGIRAAHSEQRVAEARLMAEQQDARADRLAAEANLSASGARAGAADRSVLAAEEAYRLGRIGFEAGRLSQMELRSTRNALISARTTAVEARLARVIAEIDLARLEGRAPFGVTP